MNEQIEKLGETFSVLTGERTFMIAGECARPYCLEMIEITLDDYRDVREQPRRYMVRAGHVDPEVETVAPSGERYLIVEKPVD